MGLYRRDKEENGYNRLLEKMLALLEQLCGNRWTDFNTHDPGVTITEVLNYALYELDYQCNFAFETYLGIPEGDEAGYRSKGLFPGVELLAPSVITTEDYKQLITAEFPEVEECTLQLDEKLCYHITVWAKTAENSEEFGEKISQLYHSHRNLGERLGEVIVHCSGARTGSGPLALSGAFPVYNPFCLQRKVKQNLSLHSPVRYHLPGCYGVGENSSTKKMTREEQIQQRQLKGYLLLYDLLLENTNRQLKSSGNLLDLSDSLPELQFSGIEGEDTGLLIDETRINEELLYPQGFFYEQKSRFLDLVDTLYGEQTGTFFKGMGQTEKIRHRTLLIQAFPELARERARAVNLLEPDKNSTSLKTLFALLQGVPCENKMPLCDLLARYSLQLLDDRLFFTRYKYKLHIDFIDKQSLEKMEPVPFTGIEYTAKDYGQLSLRMHLLWHNILFESFLLYGSRLENYRILPEWGKGYILVFKIPGQEEWLAMGHFYEKESLIETANLFCGFIKRLNEQAWNLYLVEHLLLQPVSEDPEHPYRISVVFPWWAKMRYGKQKVRQLLRERLPAHLDVRILWLKVDRYHNFEKAYYGWRKATARKEEAQATALGRQLKTLLSP